MSELTFNYMISSIHSLILMMNPKLSFHFEKIESMSSCFKNLALFNNLFISLFSFFTLFFKTFLYRMAGYDSKDVYSSYIEDKEYNIFFTIITLIVFNINFPTVKSRGADSIYKASTIGSEIFKLMLDITKSFQYYYFFEKFYDLHSNLLRHTEQSILNDPINTIIILINYFVMDLYFCNFSSTTASIINILFDSNSRRSNVSMLKRKLAVFTCVFVTFYLIRFRQIYLPVFSWLGLKIFYGMDNSIFFVLTLCIIQLEKHLKGTSKK